MTAAPETGRPPIPLIVIGGYLGAGKTTMINALLANKEGRRVTVLVNDFGSINVDAALIRERSDDVIGLENGCVCCTIGGKLMEALVDISTRDTRPDLLVIETSGVSDPVRIAQVGMLDRAFRLQGVIVAVDAERIEATLADPYVGDIVRRQIEGATALVLTKTDLIDETRCEAVRARVQEIANTRIVFEAHRGSVPFALLFCGLDAQRDQRIQYLSPLSTSASHLPAKLRSFAFESAERFDRKQLRRAFESISPRLLRAKGFVYLSDGALREIHVVGGRWQMSPCDGRNVQATMIVVIGIFDDNEERAARHALEGAAVGVDCEDQIRSNG
jgi:G3E family GTPase